MTVLFEKHEKGCSCSYCGNAYDKGLRYGLNIPPDAFAYNSWWTVKFWPRTYVRWTRPWGRPSKKVNAHG